MSSSRVDVLIVGAGPTGIALATQLQRFGTRFRIIDKGLDRAHESRALAVQSRTLELLDTVGLGEALKARGRAGSRIVLHSGGRTVGRAQLGDIGVQDTRFPFILFVSQAETERLISEHLASAGVTIERGVELTHFEQQDELVSCTVKHQDGSEEHIECAYLAGCDGAHSFVRKGAGFTFEGGSYPQDFVLGDIEADGPLEADALNGFVGGGSVAIFFPLGEPTTWRVIAMRARSQDMRPEEAGGNDVAFGGPLSLGELQDVVAAPTDGTVTVRDPAWLTHFRLHHRQIAHYQSDRVFLAGDAAHIHSPVGGQGMNTGIQDAWNLGWKLALVARGAADAKLLESYEAERWPIGRFLLQYTDRLFTLLTRSLSAGRTTSWLTGIGLRVIPRLLGVRRVRKSAFRFVSELGIQYRDSPVVEEGVPELTEGPHAGDRLPDGTVTLDGKSIPLQHAAIGANHTLLLCGDVHRWHEQKLATEWGDDLVRVHHVSRDAAPRVLVDADGKVLSLLGVHDAAGQYLIRPDGYIAFRCAGHELFAVERYLAQLLRAESQELKANS